MAPVCSCLTPSYFRLILPHYAFFHDALHIGYLDQSLYVDVDIGIWVVVYDRHNRLAWTLASHSVTVSGFLHQHALVGTTCSNYVERGGGVHVGTSLHSLVA